MVPQHSFFFCGRESVSKAGIETQSAAVSGDGVSIKTYSDYCLLFLVFKSQRI